MHSTPRHQEVVDFPRCNNADIELFVTMPTDCPLVDLKVEMLLGQCMEEGTTPVATIPKTDNQLPH